jgi:hypothetical protein
MTALVAFAVSQDQIPVRPRRYTSVGRVLCTLYFSQSTMEILQVLDS